MTLVIDFGTVNTVAVLDGRLVTVDGAPWIPSAVYAGDGGVVVGVDALALARGSAADRLVTGSADAVFARMVSAARAQGDVDELVLTHPVGWGPDRVGELVSAAQGLVPRVRTVPEPVAAAAGLRPEVGESVLVVDVGGGTSRIAVVRRDPGGFVVLAEGTASTGGEDLDQRIVDRVSPSLRSPADDPGTRLALRESARAAKELLSRHESAEIVLPDHRAVRLDRAEFERLIAVDVEDVVTLAATVAGRLFFSRVLLVGGSSQVPLVARRLAEASGRPLAADPEPETAIARGAAHVPQPHLANNQPG
jgi:molecular chaperone DnaK (HSP70)